jgi:hypothetical protein
MQRIKSSVITATVRRAVQLMPRLTHHSSAQLIMTGTTISSCNGSPCYRSAPGAGATHSDADGATDLRAGLGAIDLDEARTIGGARIAIGCTLQRKQSGRGCGFVRLGSAGLLSRGHSGRQQGNNDRKKDVSHPALLSPAAWLCHPTNLTPTDLPRSGPTRQVLKNDRD